MRNLKITSRAAWLGAGSILLLALCLQISGSTTDALIMDELAHIPAGYAYVDRLDFRLNPEHPPLLKVLAAIPLAFLDLKFPVERAAWTTDLNGQWDMGRHFLFDAGNDPDLIVRMSRIGPIFLTILTALLIFLWSRKRFGNLWALVPTLLFALSPNILAHGHYVTTDVAAVFGSIIAIWAYLEALERPSRKALVIAGLAFGLAQLSKFSAVLLVPVMGAYALAWAWVRYRKERVAFMRVFGQEVGRLMIIGVIGMVVVVYPTYALFVQNYPIERQVADTAANLATYGQGPTPEGASCRLGRCPADLVIAMSGNPVLRPLAEYLLGVLMVTQRAAGGNTAYFFGNVTNVGSRLYFPAVYVLKEPLPVLILVATATLLALFAIRRKLRGGWHYVKENFLEYLERDFTHFAMLFFVLFYWFYSMKSPLNIGFRHLFPTLPFIYMLAVGGWRRWILRFNPHYDASPLALVWYWMKELLGNFAKYSVFVLLLAWFVIETLVAAPYYLSYFNQFGGGTTQGYRYVTDSNFDWGQDMLRLREFIKEHPEIDRIAIDYFGGASPSHYLGGKAEYWWSAKGDPRAQGIHWLALSANVVQGSVHPTSNFYVRNERDEYRWLTAIRESEGGFGGAPRPDYRVGTSIFIYRLP